jgi:hypothetical protein
MKGMGLEQIANSTATYGKESREPPPTAAPTIKAAQKVTFSAV